MTLVTWCATEVTDAAVRRRQPGCQAGKPAIGTEKKAPAMNALTAISRAEPGAAGPVKAVSVISTGTVRIRPEHPYGTRRPLYWWLLTSRRWSGRQAGLAGR